MKRNLIVASFAVVGVVMASLLLLQGSAWAQGESPLTLTVSDGEHKAHIFPTVSRAAQLGIPAADTGPLLYHAGGPVMTGAILLYNIYWVPAHLQNGNPTSMSTHYKNVQTNLLHDYPEHGIGNNNTQYYQTIGEVTTYIYNRPNGYVTYLDTNPYPASGCTDPATPGNCITDAQIQTEIQRVMTLNHWTGGLNKMFLLFTSSGEGSCFDAGGSSCAYTQYCAYHGAFGSAPVVYSNEPYGDPSVCSAGGPFPTGDAAADTAVGTATHELTEALTDPELNAWYSALGNEIGDLCAYDYGTNTWDSGQANQMWYGHFYEIQQEYDNHVGGCVQVGP